MNQRTTIVSPPRLNPCEGVSGSALGDVASDRPGSRFSDYPFVCPARGTEAANPTAFGQGRCK
jgi:hypothetical protein